MILVRKVGQWSNKSQSTGAKKHCRHLHIMKNKTLNKIGLYFFLTGPERTRLGVFAGSSTDSMKIQNQQQTRWSGIISFKWTTSKLENKPRQKSHFLIFCWSEMQTLLSLHVIRPWFNRLRYHVVDSIASNHVNLSSAERKRENKCAEQTWTDINNMQLWYTQASQLLSDRASPS